MPLLQLPFDNLACASYPPASAREDEGESAYRYKDTEKRALIHVVYCLHKAVNRASLTSLFIVPPCSAALLLANAYA